MYWQFRTLYITIPLYVLSSYDSHIVWVTLHTSGATKKVVFDFVIHRSIYLQVFSKKSQQSCNSTQRCIWDHVKDLCVWDHCVKGVFIRNFSGPYFPVFGLNTEICKVYLFLRTNFGVLWLNFLKWNSWNYTLVYKEPCQKSEYLSLPREQHISAG